MLRQAPHNLRWDNPVMNIRQLLPVFAAITIAVAIPSPVSAAEGKEPEKKAVEKTEPAGKAELVVRFDMPDFTSPAHKLTDYLNKVTPQYSVWVGAGMMAVTMNPQLSCFDAKGPVSVLVYAVPGKKGGLTHEIAVLARKRPDLKSENVPKKINFQSYSFQAREMGDMILMATSKALLNEVGSLPAPDLHGADLAIDFKLDRMLADSRRIFKNTRATLLQDSLQKASGLGQDKHVDMYFKLVNVRLDHIEKALLQLSLYDVRFWIASDELRFDQTASLAPGAALADIVNAQPKLNPAIRYPVLEGESAILVCSMDLLKAMEPLSAFVHDALVEALDNFEPADEERAMSFLKSMNGDISLSASKINGDPVTSYFVGLRSSSVEAAASCDEQMKKIFGGFEAKSVDGLDLRFCVIPSPDAKKKESLCYWPVEGGLLTLVGVMDFDTAAAVAKKITLTSDKAFEALAKDGYMGGMFFKQPDRAELRPVGQLSCGQNAVSLSLRLPADSAKALFNPSQPEKEKKQGDAAPTMRMNKDTEQIL